MFDWLQSVPFVKRLKKLRWDGVPRQCSCKDVTKGVCIEKYLIHRVLQMGDSWMAN